MGFFVSLFGHFKEATISLKLPWAILQWCLETNGQKVVGFLREGCSRGGGSWGTLRIPRKDWGSLGKIRGITTPPLDNPIKNGAVTTPENHDEFSAPTWGCGNPFQMAELHGLYMGGYWPLTNWDDPPSTLTETNPQKLNTDPKISIFKKNHLFQTIILGIQLLVFGGVNLKIAPELIGLPKRKVVVQPSILRWDVSFRGGNWLGKTLVPNAKGLTFRELHASLEHPTNFKGLFGYKGRFQRAASPK